MQKKWLLGSVVGGVLAITVGVYQYVNYRAAAILAEQITVINDSYAVMATQGLMPGVALSYDTIKANYWRNDYQIAGLAINVAGLGVLAEVASIQVTGFKPGALAETGRVEIKDVKLAKGMQLLLPPALAELSNEIALSTHYYYQYQAAKGELLLEQHIQLSEQFHIQYQLTLQQMQPLWQFATDLTKMDAETQQSYSQSPEYTAALNAALEQGQLQQGSVTLNNNGFLQKLQPILASTEQTAQLGSIKTQLEQYLNATNTLPESINTALLAFMADPKELQMRFQLSEPASFSQLKDEAFLAELQTAEQIIQFINLQLTVNP